MARRPLERDPEGVFGSLGVATAAVIAAALTEWIDWRAAFIVPGTVCLVTGLALWLCLALGWVADRSSDLRPKSRRRAAT